MGPVRFLVRRVFQMLLAPGRWALRRRRDADGKIFIPVRAIADDAVSARCVADLRAARDEMLRVGSARIELVRDSASGPTPDLGRGSLARGLSKVVELMRHQVAEGVLDLRNQRTILDFGDYAETQIGAVRYAGRSGGPLNRRADGTNPQPTPLWFFRLLDLAVRAADAGADDVDGVPCRRLDVLLDLSRALPADVAPLWTPKWPDPTAVPLVVWLDGKLIRRLRYEEAPGVTYTLTLRTFGLDVAGLDWARLGTFRTPGPSTSRGPESTD